ncbi:kinase-like domain-containing protein [Glomus cerebriforme]|uniref:Kinase-like domain-containing protein n=1 Tax=Glomus cerebriforme TaxID=658196 RepID=A0A397T6I5_9GLOM|nr:kinase-like domain-containing protein [Glomus cerebriforme]
MDLRSYLQQNHNDLTWKERTQIAYEIIFSTSRIHQENAIHKHLHSGNILFSKIFKISDFGFCGPADKPLDSIYGNLPYMAPEVIAKKEYTSASDIYSIGLLMWEITSGQPPFAIKHNDELAMRIVNGMRPKIIPGTPTEYKKLMKQCWDANPTKRPNMKDLLNRIRKIKSYYQYKDNNEPQPDNTSSQLSSKSTDSFFYSFKSKVYNFKDLPEPRNATIKEEQEGYRCIQFDFDLQNENKSKRILDNGKKDKSKKVKFNDNEEIRIIEDTDNEIGCQQNYTDDPNFYSEEQRISDDKMDLNFLLN